jgi:hypothetical protein
MYGCDCSGESSGTKDDKKLMEYRKLNDGEKTDYFYDQAEFFLKCENSKA